MSSILYDFYSCLRDESGTSAIEYAFIAALISVVIVAGVMEVGERTADNFETVDDAFKTAQQ